MQIVGFNLESSLFTIFLADLMLSFIFALIISMIICNKFQFDWEYVLVTTIIILVPLYFFFTNYTAKIMTKNLGVFGLTIYYTNKNNEKIEITKDQIINDIVNDKIKNNNENLQVYKQAFQITYDEYNLLKQHEVEYKKSSEYGNVQIIE